MLGGAFYYDQVHASVECHDRVVTRGYSSHIKELARLNAIESWMGESNLKTKQADGRNWHQAAGKSIRCTRVNDFGRFVCLASAKPCTVRRATTSQ